jgi:multiple sugar transport system permease protein
VAAAVTPRPLRRRLWPHARGWLFIGPVVLGTLIFNVLPMLPTAYFSLTSWNGLGAPQWAGLANYQRALGGQDLSFGVALRNTVVYTVAYVPLAMVAGLALAVLVNQKLRGIVVFRGLFFLPVITSVVAVGMVWRWIFNWQFGILNWALDLAGITGPRWLGDAFWAMVAVVVVAIWSVMGYQMVIFLAGLQGVPDSLLDAAEIDGAGRWAKFRHVVLPMISPTLLFNLILGVIGALKVFTIAYVATKGGPAYATWFLAYHIYQEAFQYFRMGYGSALAWIFVITLLIFTFLQMRLSKRFVYYAGEAD